MVLYCMKMSLLTPAKLILPDDSDAVKKFLTFSDNQVQFQLSRAQRNFSWRARDPDGFQAHLNKLKAQAKRTLIFYTEDGKPYTYSGLWYALQRNFGWDFEAPENLKQVIYLISFPGQGLVFPH